MYNVAGGGDSALYGVESRDFYLRNGANQLVSVLPLALLGFPLIAGWQWLRAQPGRPPPRVLVATAPVYLWLAALSMLPHKEERFLYVVYPLVKTHTRRPLARCCRPSAGLHTPCAAADSTVCRFGDPGSAVPRCSGDSGYTPFSFGDYCADLARCVAAQMCMAAGTVLAAFPDLAAPVLRPMVQPKRARRIGQSLAAALLLATTALSLSRTAALVLHYGAPMRTYRALPKVCMRQIALANALQSITSHPYAPAVTAVNSNRRVWRGCGSCTGPLARRRTCA